MRTAALPRRRRRGWCRWCRWCGTSRWPDGRPRRCSCRWGRGRRRGRRLAEADQVCQERVRAIHAGGQLAPETERDVYPPALSIASLDERPALLTRVVLERV